MTKRKTPQGNQPQQKKSISKAPASKGREESRAVATRCRKEARTTKAQNHPDKLARVYAERKPKASKDHFTRLTQKETESTES
jgi:hypothetical protein